MRLTQAQEKMMKQRPGKHCAYEAAVSVMQHTVLQQTFLLSRKNVLSNNDKKYTTINT